MKKGWKVFWIVCGVTAMAGLVCCAASFALGVTVEAIAARFPRGIGIVGSSHSYTEEYEDEENYDNYDTDQHHNDNSGSVKGNQAIISGDNSFQYTDIRSVDAGIWAGAVEVRTAKAAAGEVTVATKGVKQDLGLRCYAEGNELKLETAEKRRLNHGGTIVIYLPEGYLFEEVSLETSKGTITAENVTASEFSARVGAGTANIEHFAADKADFSCGAGSLTASGTANIETDIECGVGEVVYKASGSQTDYNYEIVCATGEVICGESQYSGIGVDQKIDNGAAKNMGIECGIGRVTIQFPGI